MDLSKLTDAELSALQAGDLSKLSDGALQALNGTPAQPQQKSQPSLLQSGLSNAAKIMEMIVPAAAPNRQQAQAEQGAGLVRGAASIGATAVRPFESAAQNAERRQSVDQFFGDRGIDPRSLNYQGGKVLGEIAGTAGVGGALGRGVAAAGKGLPYANSLAQSLASGGLSTGMAPGIGNALTRMLGGAVTGGAAAGMVDPESAGVGAAIGGAIPMVGPAVNALGRGVRRGIGATTGVGDAALEQAYRAGQTGGQVGRDFTSAMRGQSNMDDVLGAARENLANMGAQKQAAYRSGMANIKADKSVLAFDGIDDAIKNAREISMFKGQAKNPRAADLVRQASDEIAAWKALDPAEYHTPEGLDALKQRIGGLLESIPFEERSARTAVGNIYNSIKSEINKQAPEYSKVMREYSEASELIREIEKSLSLGQKSSADTAMRKLQSLMRNNVNTSYGYRDQLAKQLTEQGGNELLPMLAGQALNEWTPRGIQRATAGTGTGLLALTGNLPAAAGMAAISSPRLAGEAAYGLGRVTGAVPQNRLAGLLMQSGVRAAPVLGAQ